MDGNKCKETAKPQQLTKKTIQTRRDRYTVAAISTHKSIQSVRDRAKFKNIVINFLKIYNEYSKINNQTSMPNSYGEEA